MDVKGLFDVLAGYLDFLVDTLMLRGMHKYARSGEINPVLVSYFVAGVFVAYLISSVRRVPGYEQVLEEDQSHSSSPDTPDAQHASKQPLEDPKEVDPSDMASFVLLSIMGGLLFHGFLLVYDKVIGKIEIGSVKDTLNAVFAYNAIYHPFNAALKQVSKALRVIARAGRACALVAAMLFFLIAAFYFGGIIYFLYPLAAVHGTTMTYMLGPSLLIIVSFFVLIALVARITGVPFASLLFRNSSSNARPRETSPVEQAASSQLPTD